MDPNANLAEQRRIIERVRGRADAERYPVPDGADLERLTELAETLDEWLSRGGFLPDDWSKHR